MEGTQLQWQQARNNRLPAVNAGLSDGFSFGRSLSRDNVYTNQNSNSANASLSADVPIFQGFRIANDIAARRYDFMASIEDHQKIKNDVSLTVASFFLNVLVQREFLKIAQNQHTLTDTLLSRTEVLVNTGREPVSKLYELRAQLANDAYNITTAERGLSLALLDLAQLLEIENFLGFDVVAPDFSMSIAETPVPVVNFENAMETLPNVRAEELRLESSKRGLEIARSAYFPTVSAGASTSTGYFFLYGDIIPNDAFGTQITNNWRSYVGVSMNIPIFNRMSVRTNVAQSRIQIEHQEFAVESARKTMFNDIQRAMLNAKVSRERYIAAVNSVQANREAYRFVEQRYESGRSTFFDL
jgi:outer membrane protein